MAKFDIATSTLSDLSNAVKNLEIPSLDTDGVTGDKETTWQNTRWAIQFGYFNALPELKTAILMKAIWTVGKGYTTDPGTEVILDYIKGWGKDKFQDILFNMEVTKRIGGDAFCEIIRDPDKKQVINLKPLDPGSIKIVVNQKGQIIRYEQTTKTKGGIIKFKPEDIWHMCHNRLADQIHGISDIDAMENTILADEENFRDMKKIMHRQAYPLIMFKLGTDDQNKINAFVTKMDQATAKGENIYIPDDENAVSFEVVQVALPQIIMEWRADLRNRFYRSIGLPQIVPGGGGQNTESESKVIYLAFEQIVEKDQREIEGQIWEQLGFRIDLYPPATLQQDLQRDKAKDGNQGLDFQAGDFQAGVAR